MPLLTLLLALLLLAASSPSVSAVRLHIADAVFAGTSEVQPVMAELDDHCGALSQPALRQALADVAAARGFELQVHDDGSFEDVLKVWRRSFMDSLLQPAWLTAAARRLRGGGSTNATHTTGGDSTASLFHCPPGSGSCGRWLCAQLERQRAQAEATVLLLLSRRQAFNMAVTHIDEEVAAARTMLDVVADAAVAGVTEDLPPSQLPPPDAGITGAFAGAGPDTDWRGRPCTPPPATLPSARQCLVLFWGTYYRGEVQWFKDELMHDFEPCAVGDTPPCTFTDDAAQLAHASAVVLHDWNQQQPVPPVRYCGQRWVFFSVEAPSHTHTWGFWPRRVLLEQVDVMSTYRLDSDVPRPYFPFSGDAVKQGLFDPPVPFAERRSDALVAWVAANCQQESVGRTEAVLQLMQHLEVHSYGNCLHNKDWPTGRGDVVGWANHFKRDMEDVLRPYKVRFFGGSYCCRLC